MTSLNTSLHPALRNAAETYFHLAHGVDGAVVNLWDGAWLIYGSFDHAICNLAVSGGWTAANAARAAELAKEHPKLQLYEFAPSVESTRALRGTGWELSYELNCLEAPMADGEVRMLTEAKSDQQRAMVAEFMAQQFFGGQPSEIGAVVAASTAKYPSYRLFWASVGLGPGPDAALMLHEAHGRCGLYNLCLVPDQRGKGLGKVIVNEALRVAKQPVSLQCEGRLVRWYEGLGFKSVGSLQAFIPSDRRNR